MDPMVDVAASYPNVTQEDLNGFRFSVDQILTTVEKLEKQVNEVEQFFHSTDVLVNNSKGSSVVKDKGQEKHLTSTKKPLQGASHRKAAAAKRMEEPMRQFSTILLQITQHKWAWPFMDPVDVEGLGLYDYYEVIDKPMDFSTIKSKMEAKDGSGYKNVREIYSDVRLIFKNAMKYNDEKNDVHVMAKTLLEKFEKKWLQLLPKVAEEEKRQLEEEAGVKLASDLSTALYEVDMYLKSLKAVVIQKCRKPSAHEKIILGTALTRLSPENLNRALGIVSENNASFQSDAEVVDLDIDAQSDYTLRRLNVFVKDALEVQGRTAGNIAVNHNDNTEDKKNNSKRKREFCDSLAKTTVKTQKLSTL